jgi:hypothetical protein
VDDALQKIEESGRGKSLGKKVEAIKIQMLFRKQVLKQVVQDTKLWCFSEQREGKAYIFKGDELSKQVKKIIKESSV